MRTRTSRICEQSATPSTTSRPSWTTPEPLTEPAAPEADLAPDLAARLDAYGVPSDLLRQAVAHRSYCSETPSQSSYERLELLGDAVIGLVVTDYLYQTFPDLPEGDLARVRAAVVSTPALALVARELELGSALLLGRGEEISGGREKASILADSLESVIGAIYLSAGYDAVAGFVLELLSKRIGDVAEVARLGDPKNQLQELAAKLGLPLPTYALRETGPDHEKHFRAVAIIEGDQLGSGEGRSKKDAERMAAEAAMLALEGRSRTRQPDDS